MWVHGLSRVHGPVRGPRPGQHLVPSWRGFKQQLLAWAVLDASCDSQAHLFQNRRVKQGGETNFPWERDRTEKAWRSQTISTWSEDKMPWLCPTPQTLSFRQSRWSRLLEAQQCIGGSFRAIKLDTLFH